MSYRDFVDYRDKLQSFDGLAAYSLTPFGFAKDPQSQSQMKYGFLVSGNFFRVMETEPQLGRGFRPEETQAPGRDAVVVLAHSFWETEFASDPAIIGRRIRLNGLEFTVIGVAPESFTGIDLFSQPAFFVPAQMAPAMLTSNRDLLMRRLGREGYRVTAAECGISALALTAAEDFDLVLLDLIMPDLSGFDVLCRLKAQESTRYIPVIMISALDELDTTVRCIAAGAEDYLPKPFNPVLLCARISACLEKKRLLDELRAEKDRSEALLLNILPRTVVDRIKQGATVIADRFENVTILFSDLVDFTSIAARLSPEETVSLLELIFCRFDTLAARYGVEKIKTTGDGYMVAGGLTEGRTDNVVATAEMALEMLDIVEAARRAVGEPLQLRIGLHTGGLVAGVIGTYKFAYDVWGDAVNTAKRMETYSLPGRIHVSASTRVALGDRFRFEPRGSLEVKGKGPMETYFLHRR